MDFKPTMADISRIITILREDVAEQFPKYAKDIYIVDTTQKPMDELAAAAKFLGVPDLAEQVAAYAEHSEIGVGTFPAIDGVVIPIKVPATADRPAHTAHIAYGRGYGFDSQDIPKDEVISARDFNMYTFMAFHETGHALQALDPRHRARAKSFNDKGVFQESFADTFASLMAERHAIAVPGALDLHMAGTDERHPYQKDHYDGSEETTIARRMFGKAPPFDPQSFTHFVHLREVYEKSLKAMQETQLSRTEAHLTSLLHQATDQALTSLRDQGLDEEALLKIVNAHPELFPAAVQAQAGSLYVANHDAREAAYNATGVPIADRTYPQYSSTAPHLRDKNEEGLAKRVARMADAHPDDAFTRAVARLLVEIPEKQFAEFSGLDVPNGTLPSPSSSPANPAEPSNDMGAPRR